MRLNYEVKRAEMERMKALCDAAGLKWFSSDAHHSEKSASAGCCGLPDEGPLSNINRGQFKEAILIAKRKGKVHWSDIDEQARALLEDVPWRNAEGYNTAHTFTRAKRRLQNMYQFMRDVWNTPSSPVSPARYFGGVLVPSGVDENGDVVYIYNEPFVANGTRIWSVAELEAYHAAIDRGREDGQRYGHVSYPIYLDYTGASPDASPALHDTLAAERLNCTLVVAQGTEESWAARAPICEVVPVNGSFRSTVKAQLRGEGMLFGWALPPQGSPTGPDGKGVSYRAALSAAEAGLGGYQVPGELIRLDEVLTMEVAR